MQCWLFIRSVYYTDSFFRLVFFVILVDGDFTLWTSWSSCPHACGRTALRSRERYCTNPAPANGGKNCEGPRFQLKLCKIKACRGKPHSRLNFLLEWYLLKNWRYRVMITFMFWWKQLMVVTHPGHPGRPALRSVDKGWRKDGATVTTRNRQTVGEDVEERKSKSNHVTANIARVCNIYSKLKLRRRLRIQ